ncbi:MAG: radical SAM protein [Candidatus Alcyoniella australis]|nr:radical SAM protein [Candidatus Alcyoniella australis]
MSKSPLRICGLMAIGEQDYTTFRPLCFASLGAYIHRELDGVRLQVADSLEQVISLAPDLVWISSGSINFGLARSMAVQIKERLGVPVWIGGVHITVMPHTLPEEFQIGVLGEGELTAVELLQLVQWKALDPEMLKDVKGICYHDEDGGVCVNQRRPLVESLDDLPMPDRSLVGYKGEPAYMFTSRGCPYDCSFCSSQAFWGKYRAHSAQRVIEEIELLVERYDCKEIHFFDDLFIARKQRLEQIADGIVQHGWHKEISFSCTIRANLVDREALEQLKRMNIKRVTFGAESCSDPVLRYLKGDSVTAEMNQQALDLCFDYQIKVGPSFIKGAPDESTEDLFTTYEFILRNLRDRKIDYFEMHTLTPFPGTKIWDQALERGLVSEQMDFEQLRYPWERFYMGRKLPKTNFYFFDDLTRLGQRMMKLNEMMIVGLLDVTDLAGNADGPQLAKQWAQQCLATGFFDKLIAVDFGLYDPTPEICDALEPLHVQQVGRKHLHRIPRDGWKKTLTAYFKATADFDPERLKSIIWHHFLEDADYTTHAPTAHFMPENAFARNLLVFSERALMVNRQAYFEQTVPGEPFPDIRDILQRKHFRLSIFRPETDPWLSFSPARGVLAGILSNNWKLDRMHGDKRERRHRIIEQRMIDDEQTLAQREAEARSKRGRK